jgi:gamma-glutamylcysteine synthetase
MSWLLWEKLLHEGNKRFQRKTKVFNTKLKFRDPKQTFSAKVCKKLKTQNKLGRKGFGNPGNKPFST